MNGWDWFWGILIAAIAVLDFVLSRINVKYTLSYQIWRAEGILGPNQEWSITRFVIAVFLVWAFVHLVFKAVK